jgi:hypothetical protein
LSSRNRKKNSRITGDDTAAETLIKKHEEYKEAEKTHPYRSRIKAADESAQNVLAEITAELDRLRKTREESARAREYLELKLREGEEDSIARTEGLGGGRTNTGGGRPNWRRKNARRNWRQPRPRPHGRGTKRRQPRPPHCKCTRRGNAAYRRSGADCRVRSRRRRRWWSCTREPRCPRETEKTRRRREESDLEAARAKAERARRRAGVGGEGGGGGGAGGGQLARHQR